VTSKMQEIMKAHVSFKKMSPLIAQRGLETFIDNFDPMRCYFLEEEVAPWIDMDEQELEQIVRDFNASQFPEFQKIFELIKKGTQRREVFEEKIANEETMLPTGVQAKEFKEPAWCKSEAELYERLKRLRSLQLEAASKLGKEAYAVALNRLKKRRLKAQEELLNPDPTYQGHFFHTAVLKSLVSSLDTQLYTSRGQSIFDCRPAASFWDWSTDAR
jgi:carboxyl-terminal processing protease